MYQIIDLSFELGMFTVYWLLYEYRSLTVEGLPSLRDESHSGESSPKTNVLELEHTEVRDA